MGIGHSPVSFRMTGRLLPCGRDFDGERQVRAQRRGMPGRLTRSAQYPGRNRRDRQQNQSDDQRDDKMSDMRFHALVSALPWSNAAQATSAGPDTGRVRYAILTHRKPPRNTRRFGSGSRILLACTAHERQHADGARKPQGKPLLFDRDSYPARQEHSNSALSQAAESRLSWEAGPSRGPGGRRHACNPQPT